MAPVNPPAWLQAGTYPARLDRLTLGGLMHPGSGGALVGRGGVKPISGSTGLRVIQRPTPDMQVRVQPGTCYVPATSTLGGVYICHNDADYDVQLDPAHATLPRKDLVYARVADAADDTGAANEFQIDRVTGTPASSPVRPAAPTQAVLLGEVAVAAADSSIVTADITDLRTYSTPLGGLLPVRSAADIPADPYPGMSIYRLDMTPPVQQIWDGTAWRTVLDTGYGAPIGTLGYNFWGANPNYQVVSTGGVSLRYDGTNVARLDFTVPPGIPAGRVIRFTVTMNVSMASGGRLWGTPMLDSAQTILDRRIGLPGDGQARGFSQISTMPPSAVAPGPHYMEYRARVDSSGAPATFYSFEYHVEVI